MPKKRFSDEQIALALRQAETGTALDRMPMVIDTKSAAPTIYPQ